MINSREAVELLHIYGHFRHPAMPNNWNVGPAELELLQADDRPTRDAAASFQQFYGLRVTGDIGPAELELLNAERCGMPDYPDPTAAVGSGSWGMPCQKEGVTISFDLNRCPYTDWWDEILDDCIAAYRAKGLAYMRAERGKRGNIHVTWEGLGGRTIGLAQYNNRTCGDTVFCKLNPNYKPNIRQVKGLLIHELGHNDNLDHQFSGHMTSGIGTISTWAGWETYRDDPAIPIMRRYHGGQPLDPIIVPQPPPGPGPLHPVGAFVLTESLAPGSYKVVREIPTLPPPGPPPYPA